MPERPISWVGWGNPAGAVEPPAGARELLERALGVRAPARPVADLAAVQLPPSSLAPAARRRLAGAVGDANLRDDNEFRIRHTRGKSTPDLLRIRAGEADDAPDAVLTPSSTTRSSTSCTSAPRSESRSSPSAAGPRWSEGWRRAAPPSRAWSRSISPGSIACSPSMKNHAGPDLRQLVLGSEGTFGVITAVTVQVRPLPAERVHEGWRLPSFADGTTAVRRLAQDGPLPTVMRLSDEAETASNLARPPELGVGGAGGCLAIVGYEGAAEEVEGRRAGASAVIRACGGEPEAGAGEGWLHGRYQGPDLRDALLDAGALVETVETATFWSGLVALHAHVSEALRRSLSDQGTPPLVLCHISHVYPAGASLYFTVGCAQLDDPVAQWREAKAAASDAILAAGGTISHHHGVGSDHRRWYAQEIGELGVHALRAVKTALDPAGILNPGVLIP